MNVGFDYLKSFTPYLMPPMPAATDLTVFNESARSNAHARTKVCFKCDKEFANEYSRNRHVNDGICGKLGNPEYKYSCKICKKRYERKGSLARHQKQKHGKHKPQFRCSSCGKIFGYSYILTRHIGNIHKEQVRSNEDLQTKTTKAKKTKKTTETFSNQQFPSESGSRCSSRSSFSSDEERPIVRETDYNSGNRKIMSSSSTLFSKYTPIPIYDSITPLKKKYETSDSTKWLPLIGDNTIVSYKQYQKSIETVRR